MPDHHREVLRHLARILGPPETERLTYELLACSVSECAELAALVPHMDADLPDRWRAIAKRLPTSTERIAETLAAWADADAPWSGWDQARALEVQRAATGLVRSRDPFYGRVGVLVLDALRDERERRKDRHHPPSMGLT